MTGGHAYIDESAQHDYLVVCSVVASDNVTDARRTMRGLLLPGQRSVHMKDEKKPGRQRQIIQTVTSLDVVVTVYCARPSDHRGQCGARDVCLQQAAADGVISGIQRMVLDRNQSYEQRDKRSIIVGSTSTGASHVPFTYHHMARHEEPLLWIPDVIGWCYARGGAWRTEVAPSVQVKQL